MTHHSTIRDMARVRPLVLVVEPAPCLAPVLGELCDFLRIRVATAGSEDLSDRLAGRPIAVLLHDAGQDLAPALRAVAGHDPAMPVMLVADGPAQDGAAGLTNLHWMAATPGIRPLVEFLFLAERRAGVAGLIPL